MKRVVIESPYAGDIERNIAYAKAAVMDCLNRGEAPIASHLLFTLPGLLDDNNAEQRKLGIEAGTAWHAVADLVVFYEDYGISSGMQAAITSLFDEETKKFKVPVAFRKIFYETI